MVKGDRAERFVTVRCTQNRLFLDFVLPDDALQSGLVHFEPVGCSLPQGYPDSPDNRSGNNGQTAEGIQLYYTLRRVLVCDRR